MTTIRLTTTICAPIERCFDLARSIDAHLSSTASTGERVVAGRSSGLIGLGEDVTWEATHFGIRQRLTSRIDAFDRPHHFRDRMTRGAFRIFEHDHFFAPCDDGTTELRFAAPLGPIGWLVERLVLRRHLRHFLVARNDELKRLAESDDWRSFLPID